MTRFYKSLLALVVAVTLSALSNAAAASDKYVGRCTVVFEADSTLDRFIGDTTNVPLIAFVTDALLEAAQPRTAAFCSNRGTLSVEATICGITKKFPAATFHPELIAEGCESELETDLSLKEFKLFTPSSLPGAISVRDNLKVNAHVKLQKEPP